MKFALKLGAMRFLIEIAHIFTKLSSFAELRDVGAPLVQPACHPQQIFMHFILLLNSQSGSVS